MTSDHTESLPEADKKVSGQQALGRVPSASVLALWQLAFPLNRVEDVSQHTTVVHGGRSPVRVCAAAQPEAGAHAAAPPHSPWPVIDFADPGIHQLEEIRSGNPERTPVPVAMGDGKSERGGVQLWVREGRPDKGCSAAEG